MKFDDLIREGRDTDALRLMARGMYDGGKIGHTRLMLMVRVADELDAVRAKPTGRLGEITREIAAQDIQTLYRHTAYWMEQNDLTLIINAYFDMVEGD